MYQSIWLGSQSPRRQQLLRQLGVEFSLAAADIDESHHFQEAPEAYVQRVTLAKAAKVWQTQKQTAFKPVLAADTSVVLDDDILGKPDSVEDARKMLQRLSGRKHKVITGVAMQLDQRADYLQSISEVTFRALTEQEIEIYIATNEPFDKAGGYGIQGFAASFITDINGCYYGIMGLPLAKTSELLARFEVSYWLTAASVLNKPIKQES